MRIVVGFNRTIFDEIIWRQRWGRKTTREVLSPWGTKDGLQPHRDMKD
jgi:hypothetical protein